MSVMLKPGLIVHVLAFLAVAAQGPQPESLSWSGSIPQRPVPDWYSTLCHEIGLTDDQMQMLLHSLTMPAWTARPDGYMKRWQRSGIDIIPILIGLSEQRDPPLWELGPDSIGVRPTVVVRWLGAFRDERATNHLMQKARQMLDQGITSPDEEYDLGRLLSALGNSGSNDAENFLLTLQTDEFWQVESAPQIDIPAVETLSTGEMNERCKSSLKQYAFSALAKTGSERVLHALATGEGLNPCFADQFSYSFKEAARRNVGIVGYPEVLGIPLSAENHRELRAIYRKYDKEYKPRPVELKQPDVRGSHVPAAGHNKNVQR